MLASPAASPALITPIGCLHSSDVKALDKVYALEQAVTHAIRAVGKSLILLSSEPKALAALANAIVSLRQALKSAENPLALAAHPC
jgi:outer membrane protein TolC